MTPIPLELADLALAALLVVLNGALSLALRLGLERQLAIASAAHGRAAARSSASC